MSDEGRIVPPHYSGPGEEARQKPRAPFAYPARNPFRNDPDETEGRRLYRGRANAEAARQLAHERHKVRLLASVDRSPEGEKPQALNAKHESAVPRADEADAPNA